MQKKSILITGCSSGIGYDSACTLHRCGWQVFATCRKKEDCERLRAEGLESFVLDYENPKSITSAVKKVVKLTGGTLDALFNNGAYAIPGAVEDLPRDALKQTFEANLFGWHDLIVQVIPIMRAQGHGRIINCSSVLGFIPMRWRGSYVATKYALEGLTDTLRIEMRDTNIKIILLQPGPITSKFRHNSIIGFEKWIKWQNLARASQYKSILINRLYNKSLQKDQFELPASAVTKKLIRALEKANPKSKYMITIPTYVSAILKRFLPNPWFDKFMSKR